MEVGSPVDSEESDDSSVVNGIDEHSLVLALDLPAREAFTT